MFNRTRVGDFYSLLLAISEFLDFDIVYLIAASLSTILLIGLYARSHFQELEIRRVYLPAYSATPALWIYFLFS
jgi:hypothetical protein